RVRGYAGSLQHLAQPHPAPARVAHRAAAPLNPGYAGSEQPTPISRALIDRHDLDLLKAAPELGERQGECPACAGAGDLQPPAVRIDARNHREVIAHEERAVVRERGREIRERGFEVRRAEAPPDERLLAGARSEWLDLRHRARSRSRSEEHTSELQSPYDLVCRLLLEKKKKTKRRYSKKTSQLKTCTELLLI